jgi:hypothetical protein
MPRQKFKFTERDSQLLVDLYKHRFLTISQLQRLHFPSMQTAYRRMRVLAAQGHVSVFTVPGIEESIYTLTTQGLEAVAGALGVDREQLRRSVTKTKPGDYYFMRHFVAINDFIIVLKQACEGSSVELLGFIPDYYGEKTGQGRAAKYIRDVTCDISTARADLAHTPDGVFALSREGVSALFFLEIDRGTETVSDSERGVLKSLRFYTSYLLEGKYQRYAHDFGVSEFRGFRSLYVTTSATRLANIRKAAGDLPVPQKVKRFHWITTTDQLTQDTIFTPIWVSIDPTDESIYRIG